MKSKLSIAAIALATGISLLAQAPAPATKAPDAAKAATAKPPAEAKHATHAAAPTAAEIADAQSKGMVWVNLNTKVYHKSGKFYGHTKNGKFMTEDEAKKEGFDLAKEGSSKKPAK